MKNKVNEIYDTIMVRTKEEAELVIKEFATEGYDQKRFARPFQNSSTGVGARVSGHGKKTSIVLDLRSVNSDKAISRTTTTLKLPVKLREFIYQFYSKMQAAAARDIQQRNYDNIRKALSVLLAWQLEI